MSTEATVIGAYFYFLSRSGLGGAETSLSEEPQEANVGERPLQYRHPHEIRPVASPASHAPGQTSTVRYRWWSMITSHDSDWICISILANGGEKQEQRFRSDHRRLIQLVNGQWKDILRHDPALNVWV